LAQTSQDAPVQAQQTTAPEAQPNQVEEVIVTAQHRRERVQDVPVAIDTVGHDQLELFGGGSLTDLQFFSPSLQVTHGEFDGFAIRGVGTQTTAYALDQAVGTVVDDVVMALPTDLGLQSLSDIQRVEILKGPQGTLFGRNTTAGVVDITTIAPSFESAFGELSVNYGERDDARVVPSLNLPVSDTLALRISGTYQNKGDFIHNVKPDFDEGGYSEGTARVKLLWQPTDSLEAYLIGDYGAHSGSDSLATFTLLNPGSNDVSSATRLGIKPGVGNYEGAGTIPTTVTSHRGGVSLKVTDHTAHLDLVSITAFRWLKNDHYTDVSSLPAVNGVPVLDDGVSTDTTQFTQELRVVSTDPGKLQYQAGIFYYYRTGNESFLNHGTFGIPGGGIYSYAGGLEHEPTKYQSVAGYGQATYEILPQLKFTGGLRYTYDNVSQSYWVDPIHSDWISLGGPPPSFAHRISGSTSAADPSGKAALQYYVNPDLMTYVSYTHGYKGPGVDSSNTGQTVIRPETVDSLEVGVKGALFDRRATYDIAIFDALYEHFQADAYNPYTLQADTTNAGGLRTKGIEASFSVNPIQQLTLNLGVTYTRAVYTNYLSQCYSISEPGCNPVTFAAQIAGAPLANSAKWEITHSANYTQPLSNGMIFDAYEEVSFKTKSFSTSGDPITQINPYAVVNANIGISSSDGSWRVGIYARNLFDTPIIASILDFNGGAVASYSPDTRRTVGVSFRIKTCALIGSENCPGV
jgi:iron complex outermembrane receptor protein